MGKGFLESEFVESETVKAVIHFSKSELGRMSIYFNNEDAEFANEEVDERELRAQNLKAYTHARIHNLLDDEHKKFCDDLASQSEKMRKEILKANAGHVVKIDYWYDYIEKVSVF